MTGLYDIELTHKISGQKPSEHSKGTGQDIDEDFMWLSICFSVGAVGFHPKSKSGLFCPCHLPSRDEQATLK